MIKTKLTTGEIFALSQELPTLLTEKISFSLKYQINKLMGVMESSVKAVDKVREELLAKYAKVDGEQYKFTKPEHGKKFNEEFGNVLNQEEVLEHPELKLSDFSELQTEQPYRVIFKLIQE